MTDYDFLIGLTVEGAEAALAQRADPVQSVRPMFVDGNAMMGTCDHRVDRINVSTQDGVIVSIGRIG